MCTISKMVLDMQQIRLTNDHSLETASEVMQMLNMDRRLPNGRESYLKLLEDLDFRGNQDGGDQYTQFVFQGQCIILGDARVGKTSLKKSLTGEAFNVEEPKTKGVEVSLVDRKWKTSDPTTGLSFGSFARFTESALYKCALYGPGGTEFVFTENRPSLFSVECWILLINWVISFVKLLYFDEMSVAFRIFFFSTSLIAVLLRFFFLEDPVQALILFSMIGDIPRFIVGLGTAYLLSGPLKGTECCKFSSSERDSCCNRYVWLPHFVMFAVMWHYIFFKMWRLGRTYYLKPVNLSRVESTVPGQATIEDSEPVFLRILNFIVPFISGFSFGFTVELSVEPSEYRYCIIIRCLAISLFCYLIYALARTRLSWVNWLGQVALVLFQVALVLFLYIYVEKADLSLFSFCSISIYMAMFAVLASHTLYKDWGDMYPLFTGIGNNRETRASFTFILIENCILNFRKLKAALRNTFRCVKLKLLDFAGDEEYYAYHHIFMRDQAIYIVVFNMANFADNNFKNIKTKIQRLRFWLESICSKAKPKTPIFLVGTHRGHMDIIHLKTIDKHLQQHLMHSFSDELVMNKEDRLLYFPTENRLGRKDRGIQTLQKEIMSTAEELRPIMGREVPYSWIKIQDAIINLRENGNAKFCVPLRQFPVSVGNFICSNWSRETLKYFHEKGLVIYNHDRQGSELSNWILLKPAILVDIIIQLVSPLTDEKVYSQREFRHDWKRLHDTGMLTESLLKHILSRFPENVRAIKGFLEQYDIICPLFFNATNQKEEVHVTHFVLSLLPVSSMATPLVWFDGPYDKKFYVFFNRFLPQAVFQHLLSRAHRNSKAEFAHGQPVICQDVGRFWLWPNQPYRLLQLKDEDMIEVTFTYKRLDNYFHVFF